MTFAQTMHTIESHLEALQAEYDRLLEENSQLKTDLKAYIKADKEKAKAFCGNCSFLQEGLERERNNA